MKSIAKLADLVYKVDKKLYYQLRYFMCRHKFANFKKPTNLSEYLLAEMLKPEFKRFSKYADKVAVQDYVRSKGLEHILPKCYGIWDNAKQIDFDKLPSKFALKTNHGCGNHIICRDKSQLNIKHVVENLNKTLSSVFSIREPHYQYIAPKVYAEELIDDGTGRLPVDYKFMCVNGEPKCVLVCAERKNLRELPSLYAFTTDWQPLDWIGKNLGREKLMPPPHWEKMVQIAKVLSKDFEFVRVDLYYSLNGILFGELTFTPASGLMGYFTEEALANMNPLKLE